MSRYVNLLFVRHGQTQDNIDTVLQGHRDTDLTEQGHEEAKILSKRLQNFRIDVVYHSPSHRIIQTLEPFLADRPGLETNVDPDLRGQCLGELEGEKYDAIDMSRPRSADGQPGVESFDDFVGRLKRALARIIGKEVPKMREGSGATREVLIATHGVCITSMFRALENTPPCDGFNRKLAVRGPNAFEVRWTDSDDVAKMVLEVTDRLRMDDDGLVWDAIDGQPFTIDIWGKKEKAL